MDLKKMVLNSFDEIKTSGLVEETIQKQLKETIQETVVSLFKSYSEFGKDLRTSLTEAVKINLSEISFPEYNVMIENYIKEQTTAHMNAEYKTMINARLSDILKAEEKRNWKLSEIITKIIEDNTSDDCSNETREKLSLHFNSWHKDMWHIDIDPEENVDKYDCDIHISIAKGVITNAHIGNYRTTSFKANKFINLYNTEALIFRLYSQGCTIEIDQDECEEAVYYPNPFD